MSDDNYPDDEWNNVVPPLPDEASEPINSGGMFHSIAAHPIFALCFAAALACLLSIWFSNGDLAIMISALLLGSVFASLAWAYAPKLSRASKALWIVISIALLGGATAFVYFHSHPARKLAPPIPVTPPEKNHIILQRQNRAQIIAPAPQPKLPAEPIKQVQPPREAPLPPAAELSVQAAPVMHLNDGNYKFPVIIEDKGPSAIYGFAKVFLQVVSLTPLTDAQLNDNIELAITKLRGQKITVKVSFENGYSLFPNQPQTIWQPDATGSFSEDTYQDILHGRKFLYYIVATYYSDERSRVTDRFYASLNCSHYDSNVGAVADCTGRNYSGRVWKWFH